MTIQLRHLRLVNWRNFKNVDLPLRDRMFVVGPNASGKTNLLDALRFLRDIAVPGGGLVQAIKARRGMKHLRSLHARNQSDVLVHVALTTSKDEEPWAYTLEVSGSGTKQKPMLIKSETVRHGANVILQRPLPEDRADAELLSQTHLEQKTQNGRFRALADALASIEHVHIVPQVAKSGSIAEELAKRDAPGSDFIEQLAQLTDAQQKRKLGRIGELLRHAVPRFEELRIARDQLGRPHLEARYQHWRPAGGWQNEQDFSDGTLRLIGLFWAIENGSAPLLLEEPELSLHADVVKELPRLLSRAASRAGRQFIVSTHSEEMLQDRGIAPEEIVVLEPTEHETKASLGTEHRIIRETVRAKLPLAKAVRSVTRPADIEQLGLPGIRGR